MNLYDRLVAAQALRTALRLGWRGATWRYRCLLLNQRPGITISPRAYLAPTVRIQSRFGASAADGTVRIDDGAFLDDGVIVAPYGGSVVIGRNVFIGPYTVLYGHGGLVIGQDTQIAAHCVMIPANHRFDRTDIPIRKQGLTTCGIEIGEDVWLGSGVHLLDGAQVGRGCVVGAGAVVTKSLPSFSVAAGVPARVLRHRVRPA